MAAHHDVRDRGMTIWDRMPHPAQRGFSDGTLDVVVTDDFRRRVEPRWGKDWNETALRESLRAALAQPCVMVRRERDDAPPVWHVLLRDGACFVLSFDEQYARAEDCFSIVEGSEEARTNALMKLVLRYAPFDALSRTFLIHHAPPNQRSARGAGTGDDSSPATWFLTSPALLPDQNLSLADVIKPVKKPPHPSPDSTYFSFMAAVVTDPDCAVQTDPTTAYRILLAFGQIKLFGLGEESETPSAPVALLACTVLLENLRQWEAETREMRGQWRDAGPAYREELRQRVIEYRTEAWSVCIALDAAYQTSLCDDSPVANALSKEVDDVLCAFDAFDLTIESLAPLLFAGWKPTDRDRWRSMLAEEYRDSQLPWLACDKS